MQKTIRGSVTAALLFLTAVMGGALAEEQKCQLVRFYSWPMTVNAVGHLTIPVPINGQSVNMLVDTGAFYSILTRSTVDRLHLTTQVNPRGYIEMFGGEKSNLMTTANEVMIGPVALRDRPFFVINRDTDWFEGILGGEILKVFDIDFDFSGGKLNLYSQEHCPGKINYWSQTTPTTPLDFKIEGNHIVVYVDLGGKEVKAIVDTGAPETVMSLEVASRLLNIDKDTLRKKRDSNEVAGLFNTLTFQGITVNNPNIRLFSDEEGKLMGGSGQPKLIIGMGILRQLHMYIAYKEKRLYVTPA